MGNPVVHFEIVGKDVERLQAFYHDAFDWEIGPPNPSVGVSYSMVYPRAEGTINGGIGATTSPQHDGHATFYIGVPNIDDAMARIVELGGSVVIPPDAAIGGPKVALFKDPEGHLLGLVQTARPGT
jgi:uncharacterized protein